MENYFEALKLSIDEIQGQNETTIKTCVEAAHNREYAKTIGAYANVPRPDRLTQGQWQNILNDAKATLIDPQKRQEHIEELTGTGNRRDEFINLINTFKITSSTITTEQHNGLLHQGQDDYGLTSGEVEEILKNSGLIVRKEDPKQKMPNPPDHYLIQPSIQRVAISGFSVATIALVTRLIIQRFGHSGWLTTGFTDWSQYWSWDEWFEWPWFEWRVYTLSAPGTGLGFAIALASLGAGIFAYWFYFFKKKRVR